MKKKNSAQELNLFQTKKHKMHFFVVVVKLQRNTNQLLQCI